MTENYYAVKDGIEQAFCIAASLAAEHVQIVGNELIRPTVTMRPKVYLDGNSWCALYGESPQEGVAGFGKSPAEACEAFDKAWYSKEPRS